jgi:hypothetical protein
MFLCKRFWKFNVRLLILLIGCIVFVWNCVILLRHFESSNTININNKNYDNNIYYIPVPSIKQKNTIYNPNKEMNTKVVSTSSKYENNHNHYNNQNIYNETSACLLIMDDNHFLIEWIAYHYHVIHLRHIIIAIDPRSQTSSYEIIQRWKNYINITVWYNYKDYITNTTIIHDAEERVKIVLQNAKVKYNYDLIQHRARQRLFYSQCMIEHLQQNRGYTLFIDTDEFISINYPTLINLRPYYQQHSIHLPTIDEPGSVLQLMNYEQQYFPLNVDNANSTSGVAINSTLSPCIQIPRLRYGTMELPDLQKQAKHSIQHDVVKNVSHYATLRWQIHANMNNYNMNRISKTIIDLNRISYNEIYTNFPIVESIHKPIPNYCTRRKLHIRTNEQIFVIHHYIGTYEQYMFRNDSRIGNERSEKVL